MALLSGTALRQAPSVYPDVATVKVATSGASQKRARIRTAQAGQTLESDARKLADYLASKVQYRLPGESMAGEDAVQSALRSALTRGEQMKWDLLGQDLWSLSALFVRAEE